MLKMRFPAFLCSLLCLLVLTLRSVGYAQTTDSADAPPPRSPVTQDSQGQDSTDQNEPTETLKVSVNVVQLFFNVKDKRGALIPNLTKNDFQIFEDGKPQTIKYFTPGIELASDPGNPD